MIFIRHCLILATLATLSATAEFSPKGDPCAQHDSCRSESPTRTCSCDRDCREYGTCCRDAQGQPGPSDQPTYACYDRRMVAPVFAKRTCSEDFLGHVADTLACLDDDEDEMDVRNNLLVTSRRTRVTYWNKHCASCNNEARGDLEYWNVEVSCPRREEVSGSVIRTNLTYDEDERRWGLTMGGEFLYCAVRYAPPLHADQVKLCTSNVIQSCPEDYSNQKVSSKCSRYYAERKAKDSDLRFGNVHCALCNGADLKELECPGMATPEDHVEESDFRDTVEEIFTDGDWLQDMKYRCSGDFTYDPGREKCRRDKVKVRETTTVQNSAHDYGKQSFGFLALLLLPFLLL